MHFSTVFRLLSIAVLAVATVLCTQSFLVRSQPGAQQVCNNTACALYALRCESGAAVCGPAGCECAPDRCGTSADCDGDSYCGAAGVCIRTRACNSNADCARSEMCGEGVCQPRPASSPSPVPASCSDAACNDGNPCNGREACNGTRCVRGPAPNCDDRNPMTEDKCIRENGDCARCENILRWDVLPDDGRVRGSTLPDGVRTPPDILPRPPRPAARTCSYTTITNSAITFNKRNFKWTGAIAAGFSANPSFDLSKSTIRVVLADQRGIFLIDQTVSASPEFWKKDAGGTWSLSNPSKGFITRLAFAGPAASVFEQSFAVDGILQWSLGSEKDLAPNAALLFDWPGDVSGPCGAVAFSDCKAAANGEITCRQTRR